MAVGPAKRCPQRGLPFQPGRHEAGQVLGRWSGGEQHPWERDPLRSTPMQVQEALSDLGKKESSSLRPIPAVGLMCWRKCLGIQGAPTPTWEKGDLKGGLGLRFCSWY